MIVRDAIDRLLDSRFGIVRVLAEEPCEAGSPQFFHFYAETCRTEAFGGQQNFRRGGGASVDRDAAMAKAIGEVIERYCAACYSPYDCPLTPYEDAPFACVDPTDFALYRDDQYASGLIELVPFTRALPVRWTPAIDMETLSETYVPAAMVFVPYAYRTAEGERPIAQPISTGLACNEGFDRALVSAASEAIERDSFTIFWQAQLPPPRVRLDTLDEGNLDRLARFARARVDVTIFDVTTDVAVPTVMAVSRQDDEAQPALVVAAAAHPIGAVAIRKCLDELEHTRSWCRIIKATTPQVPAHDAAGVATQDDHLRFWTEQANRPRADWLFTSQRETTLGGMSDEGDDPDAQVSYIREALNSVGLRLLAADVTTPEIRALGLCVVRAIVPGLHPLAMGHRNRVLGGRRLYEVPARLGYGTPTFELDDTLNPHPFP